MARAFFDECSGELSGRVLFERAADLEGEFVYVACG